jgi:phenylacetic acid degradation operon negative regulatory protein
MISGLGLLGVEEKAARQAISRTAGQGLLDSQRVGRRACWHLSASGTKLLTDGSERIYGFGRAPVGWDGQWALLFTTAADSKREMRYHLRVRLGWAGFAPFGAGVWISPWVDRQPEAISVLSQLGVASATTAFVGGLALGDAKAVASRVWDLGRIRTEYSEFIRHYRSVRPASPADCFVHTARLVHDWRRFPNVDPGLPTDLLPKDWNGDQASELFADLRSRWAPSAKEWWHAAGDRPPATTA